MKRVSRRSFLKTSALASISGMAGAYSPSEIQKKSIATPDGWSTTFPREEIKPYFAYNPKGGPAQNGSFTIESDKPYGLMGRWTRTFPVNGGRQYRFSVFRKYTAAKSNVPVRRAGVARVMWRDANGKDPEGAQGSIWANH